MLELSGNIGWLEEEEEEEEKEGAVFARESITQEDRPNTHHAGQAEAKKGDADEEERNGSRAENGIGLNVWTWLTGHHDSFATHPSPRKPRCLQ